MQKIINKEKKSKKAALPFCSFGQKRARSRCKLFQWSEVEVTHMQVTSRNLQVTSKSQILWKTKQNNKARQVQTANEYQAIQVKSLLGLSKSYGKPENLAQTQHILE